MSLPNQSNRYLKGVTMDQHETAVIFRKFPDGDLIALFPVEPYSLYGDAIVSFMHVGQHGAASPQLVYDTKPATPDEYTDLMAELEAEPYGYKLKVYRRITKEHRATFRAEQARLRTSL